MSAMEFVCLWNIYLEVFMTHTKSDEGYPHSFTELKEDLLNKLTELIKMTGGHNITQAIKWIRKMKRIEKAKKK